MTLPSLSDILRFTTDDLNANRDGYLSDAQRRALRARATLTALSAAVFVLALVLCMGVNLLTALSAADLPGTLILLFGIAAGGVIAVAVARHVRGLLDEARAGRVESVSGVVVVRAEPRWTTVQFEHGERFQLDVQAAKALETGARYRLYYTPAGRTVVSVERL